MHKSVLFLKRKKVISSIQWYGGAILDILEELSVTNNDIK